MAILKAKHLVENKERYKTANEQYYAVFILDEAFELKPCLLTEDNIQKGIERASKNKEDVPKLSWVVYWFYKILKKFKGA